MEHRLNTEGDELCLAVVRWDSIHGMVMLDLGGFASPFPCCSVFYLCSIGGSTTWFWLIYYQSPRCGDLGRIVGAITAGL